MIHPKDKTTAMLSALYDGLEAQTVTDYRTTKEMGRLLHHVSTQERIMLLGHGSDKGLSSEKMTARMSLIRSLVVMLTLIIYVSMVETS